MSGNFVLVFDDVIKKQLEKASKNQDVKSILSKMFDKLEFLGPSVGYLLDSKLFIYELKSKRPPLRLYFKHNVETDEIYVFEFEMKT
ncbi:hypothetical protein GOV08_03445, partial [Candidatus Woesearchaeota archaeon]|nr:hypothetical protein [Candidatus Woesearchaeota archaeon]